MEKKKDNFDPLKIAELIDMAKDTKPIQDVKDEEYESLDSTDTLVNKLTLILISLKLAAGL